MSNLQSLPSLLLSLYTLLLTITLAFSSDKEALLHFKSSLRDPTGILSDWNPNDNNPCSWTGISCDTNSGQVDQVTAIQLTRNQFCSISINSGNNPSYPNPSLLPCLEENGSKLYGKLSSSIGELTHLRVLALGFNSFAGRVPKEIGNLKSLRFLDLGFNHFQGELPETIGNCGELEEVSFAGNQLNGTIPVFFAKFSRLRLLSLSFNRFDGVVLDEFGENCGFLEHLHLAGNLISGPIPRNLGNCGRLRSLVLSSNVLEDGIPKEAGNLKMLEVLDLSRNYLSRPIPAELGNCKNLKVLVLKNVDGPFVIGNDSGEFNYFGGEIPDSIVTLPELRLLWIPDGNLEGTFPLDWGSCLHLEMLNLGQNYFSGEIPTLLSKCNRLAYLDLSSNNLTGRLVNEFPVSSMVVFNVSRNSLVGDIPRFNKNGSGVLPIARLHMNLPDVYCSFFYSGAVKRASSIFSLPSNHVILHDFSKNQFTGPLLPMSIHPGRLTGQFSYGLFLSGNDLDGNMSNFSFELCPHLHGLVIDFSMNRIWGELPSEVGRHCKCIDFVDLSGNGLEGPIPSSFAYLDSLVKLNLSSNKLHGPLPSYFNQMKHLRYISLSHNNFTGNIPQELAQVISLEVLELSENSLSGEIPSAFTDLGHLRILQLDHNNLSGKIPSNFSSTSSLSEFDVSFNNLSGPVPQNLTWIRCEDLKGNPNLQPCQTNPSAWEQLHSGNVSQHEPDPPPKTVSVKSGLTPIEMASVTSCSIIVSVLVALVFLLLCMRKCVPKSVSRQGSRKKEVVTCNSIGVQLTYDNVVRATGVFNIQNCIGCGGFGATYKAEIAPGVIVAVKRLSIGRFQGLQQFAAEIRTLGRVQHSNLVTLIGYHVSESEMFLIYNYLPGGNLERFIQDRAKRNIDWSMLHKIALDIARALAYLHDDCTPRVLHRDIKPSNILLDNNFNAYLSDFGLARLLGTSETHATTDVAGTFGYVAPEYAMTCRVSDKADVYSYGVVLLELISDKKALDPTFSCYGNGFNIVAWACMLLRQGRARDFFTAGLWDVGPHDDLVETLHLAVMCTVESLSTRPSMKQVAQRLKRIQPPTC